MNCKTCKWIRIVLLLIALFFVLMPFAFGKWIAAAAILIVVVRSLMIGS